MEVKKSKSANLENKKGTWILMGLVAVFALLYVAFEWTQHEKTGRHQPKRFLGQQVHKLQPLPIPPLKGKGLNRKGFPSMKRMPQDMRLPSLQGRDGERLQLVDLLTQKTLGLMSTGSG